MTSSLRIGQCVLYNLDCMLKIFSEMVNAFKTTCQNARAWGNHGYSKPSTTGNATTTYVISFPYNIGQHRTCYQFTSANMMTSWHRNVFSISHSLVTSAVPSQRTCNDFYVDVNLNKLLKKIELTVLCNTMTLTQGQSMVSYIPNFICFTPLSSTLCHGYCPVG